MRKLRLPNVVSGRAPSPAMVVAMIALFVSLGGSAFAALTLPKDSVGTMQLKPAAVTGAKLHNNAVTSSKVRDHSLLAKDFMPGQLPQGPPGPQGSTGPATGPAGGDLSGSYPNPVIGAGVVTNSKLANPSLTITPGPGLSGGGSIALGGSSTLSVADGGIGTTQLADGAVTATKFAAGALAPDSAELGGVAPSAYGAVLSGRINGLTTAALTADFGATSGISTVSATEAAVSTLSPDRDLVARDLSIQLTASPGNNAERGFDLFVNGRSTGFGCAIGGPGSPTSCTASGPVAIPASSTLSIQDASGSNPPSAADARFGLRLTNP
ncbi:MAG TPA: hypothetical protein VJ741_15440 [Solirubrobacteraceae bacterium]|nr:hypothetical protein [Solirubrobacteraceae bacterium]